jgi:hypothetical protein
MGKKPMAGVRDSRPVRGILGVLYRYGGVGEVKNMIIEFGVYRGRSIRQLAEHYHDRTVYGFDSFTGITEEWNGNKAGSFACDIPTVPANVELVVGLIEDTLPGFLAGHPGPIEFVHLDVDTYGTTKYILDTIKERLRPSSVVLFDEYWGRAGEEHERKAFLEFRMENPQLQFVDYYGDIPINRSISSMGLYYLIRTFIRNPVSAIRNFINRLRFGDTNPWAGFVLRKA